MSLIEGDLRFDFPTAKNVERFDDSGHGMTHCMKAVDFIVEEDDCYWFIEIKDPDNPKAQEKNKTDFAEKLETGKLSEDLVIKYRDSFLYRWASGKLDKPVKYIVLLCMKSLDKAALVAQNDNLRRNLPLGKASTWKKPLAESCLILDPDNWKAKFKFWTVTRTSGGSF